MALRVIQLVIPSGASAFKSLNIIQKAGVHTSSVRSLRYGWSAFVLGERSTPRFGHYSKIFSVDGNLSSGKGAFAQKLAERLGMLYMPEPDNTYIDKMNNEMPIHPIDNWICSLEKFYADPKAADGNSYRLQQWMYSLRLLQYCDALEHLLTTGQGVILERSPFSDMVFLEAMLKQGYIRKECAQHYYEIKNNSICEFLPPHLAIYIDVPAEEVQKKLKQSGKNVPLAYLKSIEDSYKKTFLPEISGTSEVLAYDATQAQDIERVAEDIEYLKFDKGPWLEQDDVTYHSMRVLAQDKYRVASLMYVPKYLPEITIGAHDLDERSLACRLFSGKKYARGYNADVDDKNIWLK